MRFKDCILPASEWRDDEWAIFFNANYPEAGVNPHNRISLYGADGEHGSVWKRKGSKHISGKTGYEAPISNLHASIIPLVEVDHNEVVCHSGPFLWSLKGEGRILTRTGGQILVSMIGMREHEPRGVTPNENTSYSVPGHYHYLLIPCQEATLYLV